MTDDGDYDDGGGDVEMDEDLKEDQDLDGDQGTQTNGQQLPGDDRMKILNEDDLRGTQPDMRTDSLK
ncbi:unnamed protein product [Rotaria sp. Silwood2]|nr:unnamed protein product [Rotaria sp. Silwood2]CAF3406656.1 unnamed protein product [Rotaria sp. Silwood2]CAF4136152.1 unnamed protein product [Rotaria sp. Silwood2]CAF4305920.1 unnamed protein product [Rotaria sp. Silwood2]CAF4347950.1 unnamed protein product [Rotaria sp. Silwood2]